MGFFNPPKASPMPEPASQTSPEVEAQMAEAMQRSKARRGRSASLIAGALSQRKPASADMQPKELLGA